MWHWIEKFGSIVILAALARSVFVTYLSNKLADVADWFIERYIIKTERQMVIWVHYRFRARHEGHQATKPLVCQDGECVRITK